VEQSSGGNHNRRVSVLHNHTNGHANAQPRRRSGAALESVSRAWLARLLESLTAAEAGDFSARMPIPQHGALARKISAKFNQVNTRSEALAGEIARVEQAVRREGRMNERASLDNHSGGWSTIIKSINSLISGLVQPTQEVARVISAVAAGDLTQKMAREIDGESVKGEFLRIGTTVNSMVDQLSSFAAEVTRVATEVGTEGKLGGQAAVRDVSGTWKDLTDSVNLLANNLTTQVRNIANVTTSVARGDLSRKITVDVKGEILELKDTINTMVDQLSSFASEVTRVAREVGTDGKLGGQAQVRGVSGIWKDLTDNVNLMASNLTTQVRGIVTVVTAVANGDLSQKLVGVEAKGEIAALAETINSMIGTLAIFADQVTTVAREVGIEGKLGGQAKVPGAAGIWRSLVDNVNELTTTLTLQVRAISAVATAVAKGDLSRSVTVEAQGEIAALKDNVNQMIINLRETTRKNTEQNWLKTNLARFSGMMQGQKNLESVSRLIMSELTPLVSAHHGAFFLMDTDGGEPLLKLTNAYAYRERRELSNRFRLGEGLVGQCALEKKPILLTDVPSDYIHINSGLGAAKPLNIIVIPSLFEGEVKAVIELASFHPFSEIHEIFFDQLSESIGVVLNMISANMRTEQLLRQSQSLTQELQIQSQELTQKQEALTRTNAELEKQALELEEKARQLEEQNARVEIQNLEVEEARRSLEEKAEQLALVSKYKSEFLANMSHELRTPLNSMLVLNQVLAENRENNLTEKQLEYVRTIHSAGHDLLKLINEVLDLAKVEAGKIQPDLREVELHEIRQFVEVSFAALAESRNLKFRVEIANDAPTLIATDPERLEQVLKNLLANAFKFTEHGGVTLHIGLAPASCRFQRTSLNSEPQVLAFSVTDTGIGIAREKHWLIFEAFQQADGTTARKYGGTGLGLSISREIAQVLGGEIQVESVPGCGSTFTLFLPLGHSLSAHEAVVSTSPALLSQPPRPTEQVAGARVLVVDDDLRNTFAINSLLQNHGVEVIPAENGRAAIQTLHERHDIDLVLMDIMMPDVDGYATIGTLRGDPDTSDIPIIAVTARALPEDHERCMNAGASEYLAKPIDSHQLLELIATWTGKLLDARAAEALNSH
jgi:signal transduction histidine kinase/HAMP domain-containing protein/ActR/RegA family two-component response regulator